MARSYSKRTSGQPQGVIASLRPEWAARFTAFHTFGHGSGFSSEIARKNPNLRLLQNGTITPVRIQSPRGAGLLGVSNGGSNYLYGSGGTGSLSVGSSQPLALVVYTSVPVTASGGSQPLALRSSGSGNPIADLSIGRNGVVTVSGAFVPIARDDAGSLTYQSTNTNVSGDLDLHLLVIQRDGTNWSGPLTDRPRRISTPIRRTDRVLLPTPTTISVTGQIYKTRASAR